MPAGSFDFGVNYAAMTLLAVAVVALFAILQRSPFGFALAAIRQDIDAAEALGVDSTRWKLAAHAISAALVAVAGCIYAINFQYVSPGSVFDFRLSLSIVLMPIIGGVGTLVGPVLGAVIFSYLQIKLLAIPALRDSYLFLYGGLLILVMLFEPKGIVGLWERLVARVRSSPGATVPKAPKVSTDGR
jgi:branched-chain amino acid transport system permease protein